MLASVARWLKMPNALLARPAFSFVSFASNVPAQGCVPSPASSALLSILLILLGTSVARAGGGPENLFLVVNARSWASLTLANHFIQLRNLPASNVLYLDWTGPVDDIDLGAFRSQLLTPVLTAIQQRHLSDHIDLIVYSADFPWAVNGREEFKNFTLPEQQTPVGSLTGLTFFFASVEARTGEFLGLVDANRYARPREIVAGVPTTHGFRSWYGWAEDGALLETGGKHYVLSTMLSITSGRGLSVSEAVRQLQRSAAADGTRPRATIYYVHNEDIRSRVRQQPAEAAVRELRDLGVAARIIAGKVPFERTDIQGVMMGTAEFDWSKTRNRILPGAICESLTSCAGQMHVGDPQTPLTEFLRFGAAGSSGTVVEPYALQAKFPLPAIHVHYASGCSLAEAYYQSVAAPFQLLIVGDPLCAPWAVPPRVSLNSAVGDKPLRGRTELQASVATDRRAGVDQLEWFLDGAQVGRAPVGESVSLNTPSFADGYHELRIVGSRSDAIETQGRAIVPFMFDNRGRRVELELLSETPLRWGQPIRLTVRAPGATACLIVQGSRILRKIAGKGGEVTFDPQTLGQGPVRLQALAIYTLPDAQVLSPPLELVIEPNEALAEPVALRTARLESGFLVAAGDRPARTVSFPNGLGWLALAGVGPNEDYTVSGVLEVRETDTYQFHLRFVGQATLAVDGRDLFTAADDERIHMVPVALQRGRHQLSVRGHSGRTLARLELGFGGPGIRHIDGKILQHEP